MKKELVAEQIGVIGCGWLGTPLAQHLVQSGYKVKGTTTTEGKLAKLEAFGIKGYTISITDEGVHGPIEQFLDGLSTVFINIPPRLRKDPSGNYTKKISFLLDKITESKVSYVLFASSTAVYGNAEGTVDEDSPVTPSTASGKQLVACEEMLSSKDNFISCIIRFAGLIGKDRHPITTLSKKGEVANANHPINLIQLNDCISLVHYLISKKCTGLYNAVDDTHPSKKEYYTQMAISRQLPIPQFIENDKEKGKVIISNKKNLIKYNGISYI